ncbi:MAG: glycosyltransferase family 4 protein [Lachnospiraceae bacterium]
MRILSITAQKPNSTGSGVYLSELVKEFEALGAEQAVVVGIESGEKAEFSPSVKMHPVYYRTKELPFAVLGMSDEMPYESTKYSAMTTLMVEQFQQAFLKRIQEVVESFQPDIILCHHLYLLTAMVREAFSDQIVMGICHGTGLRQLKKNPLKKDYIQQYIGGLDQVLALHQEQKSDIIRIFGVEPDRITVIGSGYNAQIFKEEGNPEKKNGISLIYAGKLSEKKGVMSLLRSLSYLSYPENELELSLAGGHASPEEFDCICKQIKEAKYPVHLLGKLTQPDLAKAFQRSDVFVLPSFSEGLPLVVLEALGCGAKVVCTDLPGVQQWMEQHLPGNQITYVTPPTCCNADEPREEELPRFEKELARAVERSIALPYQRETNLHQLTWKAVCQRILDIG